MIEQISNDFCNFVSIEAHVEAIIDSVLCLESEEVRMVGIVGPSGIGKTTIARALFSRLSSQFDHQALENVKRTIHHKKIPNFGNKRNGWKKLFLSDVIYQDDVKVEESLGVVEQSVKDKKVLIIVDDADELELHESMLTQPDTFGSGSRIVLVTQDKALLESHKIEFIYEVQFPSTELALQMFSQSAFGQTFPPDGLMELAVEVTNLAGILPLGLNVLGLSLRGKDKEEWVEMMPSLRNSLNGKIEKTLRVSYNGLEAKDQEIFLYIVCLLNGYKVDYIRNMLGDSVEIGLQVLADKSLICISPTSNTVQMHCLLQKLGKEIVRAESFKNPGERRFLVDANSVRDVFTKNTGTDQVLAINCKTLEINKPLFIDEKSFEGMCNLQFIKIYKEWWGQKTSKIRLNSPRGLVYLPPNLRLLHWDDYPAIYIPSNFSAEHLVELIMVDSKLEKLWEGIQPLQSLKKMNTAGSKYLKEIPNLTYATNLETLNLEGCTSLVTLPSSIGNLKKLRELWMSQCLDLEVLPSDINLESLDYLGLMQCSRLKSFPRISRNISRLHLDGTAVKEEDCLWIENLSKLTELVWENCPLTFMPSNFHPQHLFFLIMENSKLEKLWTGVELLDSLKMVDLSGSENLKEIPGLPTNLTILYLDRCESLEMLPSSMQNLDKLEEWSMQGCESLKVIPDLPKATNLEELTLNCCISLEMLPYSIQNLDKLTELDMTGCTSLVDLPTNINMVSLKYIGLRGCSRLRTFPQFSTSIKELHLHDTAIEEVPSWIANIKGLSHLRMRCCEKLKIISANMWSLKCLESVDFTDCSGVTSVSDEEMYLSCSDSDTEFLFQNCFNLDQDAQKFILQSCSRSTVLPGKEVPTYFMHQTFGSYLIVPLPQSSLSQNNLGFTACIIPDFGTDFQMFNQEIIVHWKLRGVNGEHKVEVDMDSSKIDHLVVFHFNICFQEEPPSQLDCNNVEFEFKFHYITGLGDIHTISLSSIKGCGVRVSPSLVGNDRSSETEYTDQSPSMG